MKVGIPFLLLAALSSVSWRPDGHPFDASRIVASVDSFVVMNRVADQWRPAGGVIQAIARDGDAIRMSVEYAFPDSKQRVEMAMHAQTLAPIAHWETLSRRGTGDTHGEVMFSDGRARGAFILSKRIFDVALDSGVVDNDASTALLSALPLDSGRAFAFRSFASPGAVEVTRVRVEGTETVSVPAGRFPAYRLTVMARDTSTVFVSTSHPRRVVLVRVGNGSQEMWLVNAPR